MHIFHKWSKWEEYEVEMFMHLKVGVYEASDKPIEFVEKQQKRTCETCGYTQRKKVDRY